MITIRTDIRYFSFIVLFTFFTLQTFSLGEKPIAILVYVDDLGFGDIGVNGLVGVNTRYRCVSGKWN